MWYIISLMEPLEILQIIEHNERRKKRRWKQVIGVADSWLVEPVYEQSFAKSLVYRACSCCSYCQSDTIFSLFMSSFWNVDTVTTPLSSQDSSSLLAALSVRTPGRRVWSEAFLTPGPDLDQIFENLETNHHYYYLDWTNESRELTWSCCTMLGSLSRSRWSLVSSISTGEKQMARLWGFILFLAACDVTAARWSSRWTRQFWDTNFG